MLHSNLAIRNSYLESHYLTLQITSAGYPYNASIACDYILSVDAGKYVEVTVDINFSINNSLFAIQIEDLQANSCCDNLLLTDAKIGGALVAKFV